MGGDGHGGRDKEFLRQQTETFPAAAAPQESDTRKVGPGVARWGWTALTALIPGSVNCHRYHPKSLFLHLGPIPHHTTIPATAGEQEQGQRLEIQVAGPRVRADWHRACTES